MTNRIRAVYTKYHDYIYDPAVPLKDRAFILFSTTVLIALFMAIPSGMIMREPLTATLSTLVGALFFTAYVAITIRRGTIARARVEISLVLVFVFLLVMSPFRDYTLMRLDGECWEGDPDCSIDLLVNKNDDFRGWDPWKEYLKKGFDCTVTFERQDNRITVRTENAGIAIRNTSEIRGEPAELYVSLSGDQCALTNIRIEKGQTDA